MAEKKLHARSASLESRCVAKPTEDEIRKAIEALEGATVVLRPAGKKNPAMVDVTYPARGDDSEYTRSFSAGSSYPFVTLVGALSEICGKHLGSANKDLSCDPALPYALSLLARCLVPRATGGAW